MFFISFVILHIFVTSASLRKMCFTLIISNDGVLNPINICRSKVCSPEGMGGLRGRLRSHGVLLNKPRKLLKISALENLIYGKKGLYIVFESKCGKNNGFEKAYLLRKKKVVMN